MHQKNIAVIGWEECIAGAGCVVIKDVKVNDIMAGVPGVTLRSGSAHGKC